MPHESLLEFRDPDADYHAFIAIHSTVRGPAIGGTRMRPYASIEAARADALRLSEAMSRKTALAGLRAGGGKSVIIAPALMRSRERLLRAHGQAVDSLGGRYITAPDVGLAAADLDVIATETRWVARHRVTGGVDGTDTARGTAAAMRAGVRHRLGRESMRGLKVGIQGAGNVGAHLAAILRAEGAEVLVADLDTSRAAAVARATGATTLDADAFLGADVDVLAPCALGGLFDDAAARVVRAPVITGAANNQLAHDGVDGIFMERGILFVPDILASAGGVIAGFSEFEGATRDEILAQIDAIGTTVARLLAEASRIGATPTAVAERQADLLLAAP